MKYTYIYDAREIIRLAGAGPIVVLGNGQMTMQEDNTVRLDYLTVYALVKAGKLRMERGGRNVMIVRND